MGIDAASRHGVELRESVKPPLPFSDIIAPLAERTGRVVDSADRWFSTPDRYITVLSALAVLQIAVILTHRPWLDEWQGLLLATQPPTFSGVLAQLGYEGHPPLWYALLRLLAQLLPLPFVFPAISLLMAAAVWASVLWKAPFNRAERVLLLAAEPILLEYITVARSLGLGVVILLIALALWRRRSFWLVLSLLPLTDFFFGMLSMMLIALRLQCARSGSVRFYAGGLVPWAIAGGIAAITVIPSPGVMTDPPHGPAEATLLLASHLSSLFLPFQISPQGPMWSEATFPGLAVAPFAAAVAWAILADRKLAMWLTAAFVAMLWGFAVFVYPLYFRHVTLVSAWLIGVAWVLPQADPGKQAWRSLWFLAMALAGIGTGLVNLKTPFDTADRMAQAIERLGIQDRMIISTPDWYSIAISGRLGKPLGGLDRGCASTFIRWNAPNKPIVGKELASRLAALQQRVGSFYVITRTPVVMRDLETKVMAVVPPGYIGHGYLLYRIGPLPTSPQVLPPCITWPAR